MNKTALKGPIAKKTVKSDFRIKTPRSRKPEGISVEEWQIALRREYGVKQKFKMKNIGSEPIFSEFTVSNPQTGGQYRVAIRGIKPGDNYCSCPDYAVNTLGTCKHIEFVLSKLVRKRGARAEFGKGCRVPYSCVYLRYGVKNEVAFQQGLEISPDLSTLARKYFDKNLVLKPECYSRFEEFLRQAGKLNSELRVYDDAVKHIAQVRDAERLKSLIDKNYPMENGLPEKLLKAPMYPYQQKGAIFLARAGRAIIADEMGLGKTIQAIAACEIIAKTVGLEHVLIICPSSLKYQWKDEISRFAERTAVVVDGLYQSRMKCFQMPSFYKIINYNVVHRDKDLIKKWNPDMIILDEAQRIKNWKTRTARSVKALESTYALVLTGTPLENRIEELHSIVEFIDNFHLGPRFRFLFEHQVTDEKGKVTGYKNLNKISQSLAPILVRRKKDDVLPELPERLDKNFFVDMTSEQMKYHEENKGTVARIVAKWRRFGFLTDQDQHILMVALQNMRMSCVSTYLLSRKDDFGTKADELIVLLSEIFEENGAKAVIFSQWLGTHEIVARRMQKRKWDYILFHGGLPGPKRKEFVSRFKTDPNCRIFLATEAGSVGMNLQNASAVINMDIPWNPAVLEQRIGRVHRLGQHRPVRVINFISNGTIEHGMLSLLKFKKSLFSGVLDGESNEVFFGGTRMKRFMESVEKATDSIPVRTNGDELPSSEKMKDKKAQQSLPSPQTEKPVSVAVPAAAWEQVAAAGIDFLSKLAGALTTKPNIEGEQQAVTGMNTEQKSAFIERDQSGRSFLKFPLPSPEILNRLADALHSLAGKR